MKRTCLLLALSLLAPPALAVMVDPSQRGEVLIFPYYTVQQGHQTLLSISNSSNAGKALKVRFREARNGREVYAFNLYLAEFDVWTAALFATDASGPVQLLSFDNSCTVPALGTAPFVFGMPRLDSFGTADFSGARADAGPADAGRTREGYIEVIEMGSLVNNSDSDKAATHIAGLPQSCMTLRDAWATGGYWLADPTVDLLPPSGQLSGAVSILQPADGGTYEMRATALSRFSIAIQHSAPGAALPDLSSAVTDPARQQVESVLVSEGRVLRLQWPQARAIDAVSAALSQAQLENEYNVQPALAAATDWVLTFPTRRHYTDPALTGGAPIAPFTGSFGLPAFAGTCELFFTALYDRETRRPISTIDFITPPPPLRDYCQAAQVIGFNRSAPPSLLGSALLRNQSTQAAAQVLFTEGFVSLQLQGNNHESRPALGGERLLGLPAIGFAAIRYRNGGIVHSSTLPHTGQVACRRPDGTPCAGL